MIQIIGVDIDGTILDYDAKIEEKLVSKINNNNDQIFAVLSGRNSDSIKEVLTEHKISGFKYISSFERYLYFLSYGNYQSLTEFNKQIDLDFDSIRDYIPTILQAFIKDEKIDSGIFEYYSDGAYHIRFNEDSISEYYQKLLDAFIIGHYPKVPVETLRNRVYLTIRHKNFGKGNVIKKISEIEKIPFNNILVIGDSQNDVDMLNIKGINCGCPSNSEDIVKKTVETNMGYISPLSFSSGVIDIINKFNRFSK